LRCRPSVRRATQSNRPINAIQHPTPLNSLIRSERFLLVIKSMTFDDLERPKRTIAEKIVLRSPPEK